MRRVWLLGVAAVGFVASGCFLFAAGAGAGAAVYYTDRGVQSVVAAPVDRTFDAARETLRELGISESRATTTQEDGKETRTLEGKTSDRDVTIDLKAEGEKTKVDVVAKKTAVTWDKDFARQILNQILEKAK